MERVALERAFGGAVWEALLQNPQLTATEVAHIAKNGTLPKPLVGAIVANAGWPALHRGAPRARPLGDARGRLAARQSLILGAVGKWNPRATKII